MAFRRGRGSPPNPTVFAMADEHIGTKVASMDARLGGVEGAITKIFGAIEALGSKIDRRSETPWGSIWAACGVVLTVLTVVGGMAIMPLKESSTANATRIDAISTQYMHKDEVRDLFTAMNATIKSVGEMSAANIKASSDTAAANLANFAANIDRRADISNARRDDYQKMADKRSQDNTDRIVKLEDGIVRRGEHQEHWAAVEHEMLDKQREIDDLRFRLNDIFSAKDIIRQLGDRLYDTQRDVWNKGGK